MDTKEDTSKFKANLASKNIRRSKHYIYSFLIHFFILIIGFHFFHAQNSTNLFKSVKLINIYLSTGPALAAKPNPLSSTLPLNNDKGLQPLNPQPALTQGTAFSSSTNETSTRSSILIHIDYPTASRRLGEEGEVLFKLNADNTRENISYSLIQSSGYQRLDQAASNGIENLLSRYFDQIESHFQNKSSKHIRFIFALNEKAYAIL